MLILLKAGLKPFLIGLSYLQVTPRCEIILRLNNAVWVVFRVKIDYKVSLLIVDLFVIKLSIFVISTSAALQMNIAHILKIYLLIN
jgi:hypothetical protein